MAVRNPAGRRSTYGMIRAMAAVDPYAHTIRQAAHDAVRALLSTAPDSPEGSAALLEVTAWLAREHGPAALLDLAADAIAGRRRVEARAVHVHCPNVARRADRHLLASLGARTTCRAGVAAVRAPCVPVRAVRSSDQ